MPDELPKAIKGVAANKQGRILERTIVPCLQSYGFIVVRYSEWKVDPSKIGDEIVLANVPYTTIYGHPGFTEFLLKSKKHNLEIRIECKWQQSSGSVDEKLPYLYLNCLEAVPEREIVIVVGGGGMKKGAIAWLKNTVLEKKYCGSSPSEKNIHVFSLDEFVQWANRTFGR
jgi:hypothetical protein